MSRDVIMVGSTMRIMLLYRGEYSHWNERFMNYLIEQTDGEAMINSIQNGNQPLPVIAQVSLARNVENVPPILKDPKFWTAEEKKTRKIDRLARSLLIQGIPNDIYSLIDRNENAKDLWDALERTDDKKVEKKDDEKKRVMSKVKCYNCKKEGHFAKDCKKENDQAWMESTSDSDQEINANMVFMAKIEKVLLNSVKKYYDNSTNYGLFVNNDDDQEIFHDAIESASENFIENRIDSQKDYDKSEVDHNDSEEKEHLVDKLIQKFNHKIAKYEKRIEKANQQNKDLENQNKDLQDKYDVLINQVNCSEKQNNDFNEQIKVLNEKNADLLAQMEDLHD
nr:hypothetical protein [Tanacetum cinerariifolium]